MRWVGWLPARAGFLAPDRRSGARGHGVGLVVLASALAADATIEVLTAAETITPTEPDWMEKVAEPRSAWHGTQWTS